MNLGELVAAARTLTPDSRAVVDRAGAQARPVTAIVHDSRAASPGAVFVAVRGARADGADFAVQALTRGALAIVAETPAPQGVEGTWLRTTDARLALAELSSLFYGAPSLRLTLVGVTGTNGKTTITYLLAAVFDAAGRPCGRIGTVTVRVGPLPTDERDASHTTPEAPEIQRLLAEMLAGGCQACAMEVSSHALALHRVDQLHFAAGIFTNLTRDHLDFHGDMQQYFQAKRRLFEMLPAGAPAIINADDPRGQELSRSLARVMTYAIDRPADVRARSISSSLDGLAFDAETPRGTIAIRSRLVGRPNVYNILATVAAAVALGVPAAAIEAGIANLDGVPGRFQLVSDVRDDVRVVVDYAHTDDALKNLLETARPLAQGRVITVFGCGGDRDRTKRPLMGAVAARLSDLVVLTSDNPRSEDPARIIEEIKRGIVPPAEPGAPRRPVTPCVTYLDRRVAIEQAIRGARPDDLVLVAGKGHEQYQVIGDRTLPFNDVDVARAALEQRRTASPRVTAAVNAFLLTAGMVVHATGGRLVSGAPERTFGYVSTDSRSIQADTLFVALAGPRFDGHDFVDAVIAQGAAGVLTSRVPPDTGRAAVIVVPDTLRALQDAARDVRRRSAARVIAITGSAGKTTTKEITADFLSERYRVFRNAGNLNNHIGLPLSLLELRHGAEVAVVELGMNHAGEIRTLVQLAEPDVRVWTNVGDAHLGHFTSRDEIADAKAELLDASTPMTLLVANADDSFIVPRLRGFAGRTITFGEAAAADVHASNVIDRGFEGTVADVDTPAGRVRLTVPLAGRAHLGNVLAALAVAVDFGVPLTAIEARAGALRPVPRRGELTELASGARLIDDSYNASPAALRAMLAALSATPASGRRIAVIGEMLELGQATSALHAECGRAAVAAGVDELVVIGGIGAEALARGAAAAGLDAANVHTFKDSHAAAEATVRLVHAGDLVLVKGSRGTRTDIVADRLKEVG